MAGQRPPQVSSLDSGVGRLTNVHKRKKEPELSPFYLSRPSVMVSQQGRCWGFRGDTSPWRNLIGAGPVGPSHLGSLHMTATDLVTRMLWGCHGGRKQSTGSLRA